jgi:hypothetical protein
VLALAALIRALPALIRALRGTPRTGAPKKTNPYWPIRTPCWSIRPAGIIRRDPVAYFRPVIPAMASSSRVLRTGAGGVSVVA